MSAGRKVAEVDAKKRREATAKKDAEEAQQLANELAAKKAEAELEMQSQVKAWQDHEEALKLEKHSPAWRVPDYTEFPDRITLPDGTTRTLKHPGYQYRWTRYKGQSPRLPLAKIKGWKPVRYDERFEGTEMYEKTIEGYVLNGDVILMEISDSGMERLQQDKKALYDSMTGGVESQFHADGAREGVRTFREDRRKGTLEYA